MKATDWIWVGDSLPARDGKHNWTRNMLVHLKGPSDFDGEPNVTIAFYNHVQKVWFDLENNVIKPTHWMPIVSPWEG